MKRTLFTWALAMQVGLAGVAWCAGEGFAGEDSTADSGLPDYLFEDGPGVDPVYSTPNSRTRASAAGTGAAGARKQKAFIPNDIYFEYFGNMSISGQPMHLQVYNAYLCLPLTSSEKHEWNGWQFDASASVRNTWMDCSGRKILDESRLYTVGAQASLGCKIGRASYAQVGVVPQFSSDFDVMSHENFYWGCYGAFSSKVSDNFRFTAGVACMPDYYDRYVFPLLNVAWRYNTNWEARVQATRFSLVNVTSDKFQWGPFFQWNAARWTVHRDRQTQQFRMTNCILGMGCTYDIKTSGGMELKLLGDLGGSFYNTFRVHTKNGEHELERYRGNACLYGRFGVQISF